MLKILVFATLFICCLVIALVVFPPGGSSQTGGQIGGSSQSGGQIGGFSQNGGQIGGSSKSRGQTGGSSQNGGQIGGSSQTGGECLENLRIIQTSNSDLTLGWNYKCGHCSQCSIGEVTKIRFKIYWNHEEWLAFETKEKDLQKPDGRGHTEIDGIVNVQNYFKIQVPARLHPYSRYKLSVKALPDYKIKKRIRPEEKFLYAETKP